MSRTRARADRRSAILERVADARRVDVASLAVALDVSEATVRRDLQQLSGQGLLVRTHGGAVATDLSDRQPIVVKASLRQPEKRAIGAAAAALVPPGAVVGMTGGSTTLEIARALAHRSDVTVVTNAIPIATELVGRPGLRLVVIGGMARASAELVGPAAEAMLAGYHLDVAFIGVDGLSAAHGLTTYDEMEAQTDRAFISRASRSVVATDSSKLGQVRFAQIAPARAVHDVLTDVPAEGEARAAFDALTLAGLRMIEA